MSCRRILIVEDDADIRAALAAAMSDSGAEVIVADDGADALERLRRGARPAVILLDLRLPCPGGQELLAELRADSRFEHVPVITMTTDAARAGGDDHVPRLPRPFDLDDLRRIVESLFVAAA
jgi:CheY-like chemotaxis protein